MPKLKSQNSKATKIDIDHVAKLANLTLTEKEKKDFESQLQDILEYISKLGELNTKSQEPIGHITGLKNITRQDTPQPSISQEDALKNGSKTYNGFFEVDAIFEEN